MTTDLLLLPAFYLLGCLTSGYYLVRIFSQTDIREHGHGSTGARDVSRVLGPWGSVATSGLDLMKGAATVWLAGRYGHGAWIMPVGIIVMLIGHIWPVQLGFRGGRGVMPAIGAVGLFDPVLMAVFVILFFVVWLVLRRLTLSGMIVVAFAPVIAFVFDRSGATMMLLFTISLLVIIAHWKILRDDLGIRHF